MRPRGKMPEGDIAEQLAQEEAEAARKPTGLLPKEGQQLLRGYYRLRPDVTLPEYLHKLQGTHGWFVGDGKAAREVLLGFEPEFVLFTSPLYPDGYPIQDGLFEPPGLHSQPEKTERGFKVSGRTNPLGEMVFWIAWKPDASVPKDDTTEKAVAAVTRGGASSKGSRGSSGRVSAGSPSSEGLDPREAARREKEEQRRKSLEERKAKNEEQRKKRGQS